MKPQVETDSRAFIFLEESPWHIRLLVWITTPFYKVMGILPLISPMVTKPGAKVPREFLAKFASMIGIDDEASRKNLYIHQRQYLKYTYVVLIPAVFLALAIVVLLVTLFFPDFPLEGWNISLSTTLTWVLFASINITAFSIIFRMEQTIADKYFADTLAVVSCLSLLQELLHEDVLAYSSRRQKLTMRLNDLSRALILLAYRFPSSSSETDQKIYQHFKNMERFVREREYWVVAPRIDTLVSLRRDFLDLLRILISGRYGEFQSSSVESQDPFKVSSGNKFFSFLVSLFGIVVPVIILYVIYINPEKVATLGIDGNTITLIAVAWLLLSIDAAFKLGIVDRISSLARTFRELQ